jgi:hypothetical protein
MYTFENHPKNKGEIMETRRVAFIVLLVFFLGTGCQAGLVDPESAGDITSTPGMKREAVETPDRIDNMAKTPERVPLTESIPPVAGEVPTELLDTIFKDLEGRTGIERRDFNVIQAQFIVWNDGSLGCPHPGILYTQALVDGYWVILEADGVKYDYRASGSGYFFLCEDGFPPVSPAGTPES